MAPPTACSHGGRAVWSVPPAGAPTQRLGPRGWEVGFGPGDGAPPRRLLQLRDELCVRLGPAAVAWAVPDGGTRTDGPAAVAAGSGWRHRQVEPCSITPRPSP